MRELLLSVLLLFGLSIPLAADPSLAPPPEEIAAQDFLIDFYRRATAWYADSSFIRYPTVDEAFGEMNAATALAPESYSIAPLLRGSRMEGQGPLIKTFALVLLPRDPDSDLHPYAVTENGELFQGPLGPLGPPTIHDHTGYDRLRLDWLLITPWRQHPYPDYYELKALQALRTLGHAQLAYESLIAGHLFGSWEQLGEQQFLRPRLTPGTISEHYHIARWYVFTPIDHRAEAPHFVIVIAPNEPHPDLRIWGISSDQLIRVAPEGVDSATLAGITDISDWPLAPERPRDPEPATP